MKAKILIIGSSERNSIDLFFNKYLKEYKYEVLFFSSHSFFCKYYSSFFNKIIFFFFPFIIFNRINKKLKNEFLLFLPDITLIFKGMEIYASTLNFIKKFGCKIVVYNADNPFIFSGRGSGNANILKHIPLVDLYLSYDTKIVKNLIKSFGIASDRLPFGFDLPLKFSINLCEKSEILKVCFIGNPDKYRAKFILKLAKHGIKIDLFGTHWKSFISHKNISIYKPIYDDEFIMLSSRYRIQLNLLRRHNLFSHNMRTFELSSTGAIQLAPFTFDHFTFFKNGSEIFLFSDFDNCIYLVNHILSLSFDEAYKIRLNAIHRSFNSGYSYKHRVDLLLNIFKKNTILIDE